MDNNVFDAFSVGFFEKIAEESAPAAAPAADSPGFMAKMRERLGKGVDYVRENPKKSILAAALLTGGAYGAKKLMDKRKSDKEAVKEAAFDYFYEKLAAEGEGFGARMRRYGGAIGSHLNTHKVPYLAGAGALGAAALARHLYKKRKAKKG